MKIVTSIAVVAITVLHVSAEDPSTPLTSTREVVASVLSQNLYADEIEPSAETLDKATDNRKRWELGPPDTEWIQQYRARQLRARILSPLRAGYIRAHDIKASDEDIAAFRRMLNVKADSLFGDDSEAFSESTQKQFQEQQISMARQVVVSYQFYAALQNEYGGTVYITHMGQPHIDGAIDRFLQAEKVKGTFSILDPELEERVLNTETNRPGYYPMSKEKAREALENPWWMRPVQPEE